MRILFFLLLAFVSLAQVHFFSRSHLDFVPHYEATQSVLQGNLDIYPHDPKVANIVAYSYSPFFPLLLAPFLKFLSLDGAKVFWGILSSLCFLGLWWQSEKLYRELRPGFEISDTARLATLLMVLDPIHTNAVHGNITTVLGVVIWGSLLCFVRERERAGGVIAALGVAIKLTPGFVLFYPVAFRRFRALAFALHAGVLFLLLIPILFYGVEGTLGLYRDWLATLRYVGRGAFDSPIGNQSPHAIFFRLFGSEKLAATAGLLISAGFAALILLGAARGRRWTVLMGCLGIGLSLQGIVWTKQHIWLLPFYLLFMNEAVGKRLRSKIRAAWVFYVFLLYGTTPMILGRFLGDWTTHYGKYLWGLLLLGVTVGLWERKVTAEPPLSVGEASA